MELIMQDIVATFSPNAGKSIADAIAIFYNSKFFEKLYDSEIGLYLEGSDYLYGIFSDEIKQGKLVQNEI